MKIRATRPFLPVPFRVAGFPACALLVLCVSVPPAFAASAASPNSSRSPTASPNSGVATGAAGTGDTIGHGSGTSSSGSSNNSNSNNTTTGANGGGVLKWSDRHFVNDVADGNHQEIVFAQLAAQQATDPGVRNYAQMLVSDHMTMGRDLMQLAQQKGVTLDSDISNYSANAAWNSTYDRTGASGSRMISGSSSNDMNNYDSSKTAASGSTPGRTMSGATSPGNSSTASTSTDATNDRSRATAGMSANNASSPSPNSGTAAANGASTGVNNTPGGGSPYTGTSANLGDQSTSGPGLGWWGDRQYRRLAKENGADFDRNFIDRMVDDHEKDVKMFEKKASDADDPDVRAFAAKQLPTLRQHLSQAQNLAQNVK